MTCQSLGVENINWKSHTSNCWVTGANKRFMGKSNAPHRHKRPPGKKTAVAAVVVSPENQSF